MNIHIENAVITLLLAIFSIKVSVGRKYRKHAHRRNPLKTKGNKKTTDEKLTKIAEKWAKNGQNRLAKVQLLHPKSTTFGS